MISENNMALLEQKCIDIAKAFHDNWATVGKAVDKMLDDANVLAMYNKAVKFEVQPRVKEYEATYNSHGYDFAFVWDSDAISKFALRIRWASTWVSVSSAGPSYLVLGIDGDCSLEDGIARLVGKLAATKSQYLVGWKTVHDSSIFSDFAKGAVEAANNLIRLMTNAYNKALDLESENDNILLSAFKLNADGPAHVKPKQYDVKIVERKTKCASMRK